MIVNSKLDTLGGQISVHGCSRRNGPGPTRRGADRRSSNAYNSHLLTVVLIWLPMHSRLTTLLLLFFLPTAAPAQDAGTLERAPQTVLHLLDYVSVEYPQFVQAGKVVNPAEYSEQIEFAAQIRDLIAALPPNPGHDAYARQAAELLALIKTRSAGAQVSARARELQQALISAYHIPIAPKHAPDVAVAAPLYAARCASCHGPTPCGLCSYCTASASSAGRSWFQASYRPICPLPSRSPRPTATSSRRH